MFLFFSYMYILLAICMPSVQALTKLTIPTSANFLKQIVTMTVNLVNTNNPIHLPALSLLIL